jgi:glutamyl-tRNA(Gln) amidotransferase subunit D
MEYVGIARKVLGKVSAVQGDKIELLVENMRYEGIVMPRHKFSAENVLVIKLANGYNVGIEVNEKTTIKLVERKLAKKPKLKVPLFKPGKQTISLLSTGGTIASYVDYRTGGVYPALTAEELAYAIPEIAELYNLRAKVLFSIFSEDITPKDWKKLAVEIVKELEEKCDAVIITHGTDAMHYTAAALAFMLRNLPAPIVLVGSQRSSDRPSTDALLNLLGAAKLAGTQLGEVVVVMHGSTSDDYLLVHRGTKVRKMHTSARDAFRSINQKPLAKIQDDKVIFLDSYKKRSFGKLELNTSLEERVALIYFYPNMSSQYIDYLASKNKGLVIAGTGLGHISQEVFETISKFSTKIPIVMASQCLYGRVNMRVYSRGRDLLALGVISAEDMLPEVAYVKLMWVLGQTKNIKKVKELFQKNIVGEITERTSYGL